MNCGKCHYYELNECRRNPPLYEGFPTPRPDDWCGEYKAKSKLTGASITKVPYQKIVELYHSMLPTCPKVVKLTEKRKVSIRQRWNDELPSMEHWENYFYHVAQSKFLMGQVNNFIADLEWLCRPSSLVKVAEGKYHR